MLHLLFGVLCCVLLCPGQPCTAIGMHPNLQSRRVTAGSGMAITDTLAGPLSAMERVRAVVAQSRLLLTRSTGAHAIPSGSRRAPAIKCPSVVTLKKKCITTTLYVGKSGDTCLKVLKTACKRFLDKKLFRSDAFFKTNKYTRCSDVKGVRFCCPK